MIYNTIIRLYEEVIYMATETIQVEGMSCDHCKHAVETALTELDGVSTADAVSYTHLTLPTTPYV